MVRSARLVMLSHSATVREAVRSKYSLSKGDGDKHIIKEESQRVRRRPEVPQAGSIPFTMSVFEIF